MTVKAITLSDLTAERDALKAEVEMLRGREGEAVAWLVVGVNAYTDYAKAVATAQANCREIRPLYDFSDVKGE